MGNFAAIDGLTDTAYYSTAVNTGLLGQAGGGFYGQCWVRLDNQNAGTARNIVSCRMGATTPTTTGHYVRALAGNTSITFECFIAAGSVVTSSAYTVQAADIGKMIHVVWVHTGSVLRLYVHGEQVGSDVAAVGYTVPTQGFFVGRRANTTGESAVSDLSVGGIAGGNFVPTAAEIRTAYLAGLVAEDVVAIPSKTTLLWSPRVTGSAAATIAAQVGSTNLTRTGAPTYASALDARDVVATMATALVPSAPQIVASGVWPDGMRTGTFRFSFTPNYNSGSGIGNPQTLLRWPTTTDTELYLTYSAGTTTLVLARPGGSTLWNVTFTAGATLGVEINLAGGTATLSGFATGSGAKTFTGVSVSAASALYVGAYDGISADAFEGTIGTIYVVDTEVAAPTMAATAVLTLVGTMASDVAAPEMSSSCTVGSSVTGALASDVAAPTMDATCLVMANVTATMSSAMAAPVIYTTTKLGIPTAIIAYAPDGTVVVDVEGSINDDGAPRLSVDRIRNAMRRGELLTQDDETF